MIVTVADKRGSAFVYKSSMDFMYREQVVTDNPWITTLSSEKLPGYEFVRPISNSFDSFFNVL